jgi:hypothetical protein
MSVAERAKLPAKTRDFPRIELSPGLHLELKEIYSDRLDLFGKVAHPRALAPRCKPVHGSKQSVASGFMNSQPPDCPAKQHSSPQLLKNQTNQEIYRRNKVK